MNKNGSCLILVALLLGSVLLSGCTSSNPERLLDVERHDFSKDVESLGMASDGLGNIHFIWNVAEGPDEVAYYMRTSVLGLALVPPTELGRLTIADAGHPPHGDPEGMTLDPHVVADRDGRAFVVFELGENLFMVYIGPGGRVESEPTRLNPVNNTATDICMVHGPDGSIHLAWTDWSSSQAAIYYCQLDRDGQTRVHPRAVSSDHAYDPTIRVGGDGVVHICFYQETVFHDDFSWKTIQRIQCLQLRPGPKTEVLRRADMLGWARRQPSLDMVLHEDGSEQVIWAEDRGVVTTVIDYPISLVDDWGCTIEPMRLGDHGSAARHLEVGLTEYRPGHAWTLRANVERVGETRCAGTLRIKGPGLALDTVESFSFIRSDSTTIEADVTPYITGMGTYVITVERTSGLSGFSLTGLCVSSEPRFPTFDLVNGSVAEPAAALDTDGCLHLVHYGPTVGRQGAFYTFVPSVDGGPYPARLLSEHPGDDRDPIIVPTPFKAMGIGWLTGFNGSTLVQYTAVDLHGQPLMEPLIIAGGAGETSDDGDTLTVLGLPLPDTDEVAPACGTWIVATLALLIPVSLIAWLWSRRRRRG
jgi:hypothetical protein